MPNLIFTACFILIGLECLDHERFGIIIAEGFPFTVNKLVFIFMGLYYFRLSTLFKNRLNIGLILLILSFIIGAVFSDKFYDNFSAALGRAALLIGAFGLGETLIRKDCSKLLDGFFLALLIYWNYYVLELYFTGQLNFLYSFNSQYQDIDTVNHHVIGMQISIAAIYWLSKLYNQGLFYRLLALGIAALSMTSIIISQSRSNFLILGLVIIFFLLVKDRSYFRNFFIVIGLLVVIIFTIQSFSPESLTKYEVIVKRYTFLDFQYQKDMSGSRLELYGKFLENLIEKPFGKGLEAPYVQISTGKALMHNQYLSYIISGGFIAAIAVYLFLTSFFKFLKRLFYPLDRTLLPIGYAIFVYFLTIFTVEVGGSLFYLVLSLFIGSNQKLLDLERNQRLSLEQGMEVF